MNENLAEIADNLRIINVIRLSKLRDIDLDKLRDEYPDINTLLRETSRTSSI